jgi:hypothetical protein
MVSNDNLLLTTISSKASTNIVTDARRRFIRSYLAFGTGSVSMSAYNFLECQALTKDVAVDRRGCWFLMHPYARHDDV